MKIFWVQLGATQTNEPKKIRGFGGDRRPDQIS